MTTIVGKIVNIQNFSLHDGPGIRTTVFFKGCPLRCLWCANPDTQLSSIQLLHSAKKCTDCLECTRVCPEEVITLQDGVIINRNDCTLCGDCVDTCPESALRFDGELMPLEAILERIQKDFPFYRNSGGGVTLSGGEPLLQPELAEAILKKCSQWGIHTAIETSGFAAYETLLGISKWLDLIYFDLKHMDDVRHRELTGMSNSVILSNLQKISKAHSTVVVRVPLVPGLNSEPDHLFRIGAFLQEKTAVKTVEFLNYHQLGEHKYISLGREYGLAGIQPYTAEEFKEAVRTFQTAYPNFNIIYHT